MTPISMPKSLIENVGTHDEGKAWIAALPDAITEFARRWSIALAEPFDGEASCSWVAPCQRADGSQAIFKIGWPHMESLDEIEGMRFWAGDPTAYLLEGDAEQNAMLLERCMPGTVLRTLPEEEQDEIISVLMRRLWRAPAAPHPFRPLREMIDYYCDSARQRSYQWLDADLVTAGIEVYQELIQSTTEHVLLATDLHAGNVLMAEREPWLVIDPKPFVGDPAYDATQHLLNCLPRLAADTRGTINRFANLLGIDPERIRLWLFARVATCNWGDSEEILQLARQLT
ncbi:MAG: aminoglycoside phosphotransferase family protein [Chloroflexota bacterium]